MKKKTYFCIGLCMIAVALFNWNCTDLELIKSNPLIQNKDFSLQEAKEFFEKQIEQYPMNTRSGKEKSKNQMSPGDFIPKWEDAIASSHTNLACYDIPIEANSHYKAMYSDYKNGKASAHVVNVYQKLVIAKDIKTGEME